MKSRVKNIYKRMFILYNILTEVGENMKLILKQNITKMSKKQKDINKKITIKKRISKVIYISKNGKKINVDIIPVIRLR